MPTIGITDADLLAKIEEIRAAKASTGFALSSQIVAAIDKARDNAKPLDWPAIAGLLSSLGLIPAKLRTGDLRTMYARAKLKPQATPK